MNRNSSGPITLNKAVIGFLNLKTAEGLAQGPLYSYERILVKWVEYWPAAPFQGSICECFV
jgi:hypothetical protein